jgi:hypothetical protein
MLQPWDDSIHAMEKLREEFLCAASGRLVNIAVKWLWGAERNIFAREDELPGIDCSESGEKDLGLRIFISSLTTDTGQSWNYVDEKCFTLSSQMSPWTFFVGLTMNSYWPNHQALKTVSGNYSDAMMISIVFRSRLEISIELQWVFFSPFKMLKMWQSEIEFQWIRSQ